MTEREWRLRRRIDALTDLLDTERAANARMRKRAKQPFRHCRWCGGWAWGPACTLHKDLEKMENQLLRMAR
jgi:hypothetical protein